MPTAGQRRDSDGTGTMPAERPPDTYRIFQHRREPGLCCAVREAMLIPYFVRPGAWDFGARVREGDSLPIGFQPVPAREATAAFGYYLFHHPCETLARADFRHWTREGPRRLAPDQS